MALADLGRRPEAETLLIQGVPQLPRVASTKRALQFVVAFYEEWSRAQPDTARAARTAEWRQRLDAWQGPVVAP
jgi:hypothetical protein